MKEVAVFEAKTRLSELLAEVEQGASVTITRRGLAVARLVPAKAAQARTAAHSQRQTVLAVMAALAPYRKRVTLDVPLKEALREGRD
jgi:prevent-host-death family protein